MRGIDYDAVLERLSLTVTEEKANFWKAPVSGRRGAAWLDPDRGLRLRSLHHRPRWPGRTVGSCEVLACSIEEHVNFSYAALWSQGARVWEVFHQGDLDCINLSTDGELPAQFSDAVAANVASRSMDQIDEDIDSVFDIPLDLAERITGFRHDAASDPQDDLFHVLREPARPAPWWKFWH
ncbi:hypothetical protein LP420_25260 [Massilia sp. B-10]|nr:hypothetical protein LP420_25260 [Massilia sp. B-10]